MSGEVKTCSLCGNMYIDTGGGVCSSCLEELNAMKTKLENFITEHPNAKIVEIVNRTGITEKIITRYFTTGSITDACPRCGAPILEGKYCQDCLGKLHADLTAGKRRGLAARAKQEEKKFARRMAFGNH